MGSPLPLLVDRTSFPHSSAIVSASSFLATLVGAGQALLIAFIVGEGDSTDAFLAGYALYAVMALFAASVRSSLVPLLGTPESEESFRKRVSEALSRTFTLAALVAAVMLALAIPAGQIVANGLPAEARWTTVAALALLTPVALFQLQTAALSAALAAAHRFAFSAVVYVAAGVFGLLVSALLLDLIGVLGAAMGMLAGSVVVVTAHGAYMHRFGVRVRPSLANRRGRADRDFGVGLVAGAATVISLQATLAISLAAVSGEPGAITAFTYAYFAVILMLTLSSPSLALVTLPSLVARIGREGPGAAARHFTAVSPFAFAVLAPLLVLFIAYGEPVVEGIFGQSLSADTIVLLYDLAVVLAVAAVPTALVYLAAAVALALERSRRLIAIGAATIAVHAAIVVPLSTLGPRAVAWGHVGSATFMAVLAMAVAFGPRAAAVAVSALRRSLPAFALAVAVGLPRLLLGSDPSLGASLAGAALSGLAYMTLVVLLWPSVGAAFLQLARRPKART